ncbi:phage tail sheath C-terminal domain-containing protein [Burkholderia stagnalis]|uniref:Phage tail sheath family protein n=1 Tax=Burkholderia stagnalis TaxID=1503054 RepID=A0ABX9YEX5_9BURK|nr:phage tail sheath C-terminal domain-containing protein [Burkholderia stagnalis]RQQ47914.1 phage tail sheath family protein [Burkholderia stagnalis]RQQ59560.1 phage tail sheath family protein [Burkholderia stagnalis]RQQ60014.1 phage tail sheath family protein [Burkholderia stagnalis]RQQ74670.1 phage tail sheath family protein [Burkholderia stagnalis]RQQ80265.1 phage tail sheath family protein [Burkholderia stagnalis]
MSETDAMPGVGRAEISGIGALGEWAPGVCRGGTAVPVLIGRFYDRAGRLTATDRCQRVASWDAFEQSFMSGPFAVFDMASAELRRAAPQARSAASVRVYFENGGGPCYVSSLPSAPADLKAALAGLPARIRACREISLLVWCEVEAALDEAVLGALGRLLSSGAQNAGYFLLTDARREGKRIVAPATSEPAQTAAYYPGLWPSRAPTPGVWVAGLDARRWGASILSLEAFEQARAHWPAQTDGPEAIAERDAWARLQGQLGAYLSPGTAPADTDVHGWGPPVRASVAMAGVLARVDDERGVWKAPAYVVVRGAAELVDVGTGEMIRVDDAMIDTLEAERVNALRGFAGLGVLAWGARTLAGQAQPQWREVSVRRLCNAVQRDVGELLRAARGRAGQRPAWARVRETLTHYLGQLWRQGALQGSRPEQAYFVALQPDDASDRMRVQIGLAVGRPSEFVVLELTQALAAG